MSIKPYSHLCHINWADLTTHSLALFVGSPGTGKTSLCLDLIYRGLKKPQPLWGAVVVLSPTASSQELFTHWDKRHIYDNPEKYGDVVENLIEFQKKVPKESRRRVLIVVDDAIGLFDGPTGKKFKSMIRQLVTSGRQWGLQLFLLLQTMADQHVCSPTIRGNYGTLVCFYIGDSSREWVEKELGVDKKKGHQLTEAAWTEKRQALVYDKGSDSTKYTERISTVKMERVIPCGVVYS